MGGITKQKSELHCLAYKLYNLILGSHFILRSKLIMDTVSQTPLARIPDWDCFPRTLGPKRSLDPRSFFFPNYFFFRTKLIETAIGIVLC